MYFQASQGRGALGFRILAPAFQLRELFPLTDDLQELTFHQYHSDTGTGKSQFEKKYVRNSGRYGRCESSCGRISHQAQAQVRENRIETSTCTLIELIC